MVEGGLASRSCSCDLRAGAVVATSRCCSLGEVFRAEVVDLRTEVAEGLHSPIVVRS